MYKVLKSNSNNELHILGDFEKGGYFGKVKFEHRKNSKFFNFRGEGVFRKSQI